MIYRPSSFCKGLVEYHSTSLLSMRLWFKSTVGPRTNRKACHPIVFFFFLNEPPTFKHFLWSLSQIDMWTNNITDLEKPSIWCVRLTHQMIRATQLERPDSQFSRPLARCIFRSIMEAAGDPPVRCVYTRWVIIETDGKFHRVCWRAEGLSSA